jgi:hypothetical protein
MGATAFGTRLRKSIMSAGPAVPDWVFIWPVGFGRVIPGARDTAMNGKPVKYKPDASGNGVVWIRRGVAAPLQGDRGFRLRDQGAISRMGIFVWGYVTSGWIVARSAAHDEGDLTRLRALADETVDQGLCDWWAPAMVGYPDTRREAIVVGTWEASRHVAEPLAIATLYHIDDDVDRKIGWGDGSYTVERNLFVCDVSGAVIAEFAAPATFQHMAPGDRAAPILARR